MARHELLGRLTIGRSVAAFLIALLVVTGLQIQPARAAIPPLVFALDFSSLNDVSINNIPTTNGPGVSFVLGGGPTVNAVELNHGVWTGNAGDTPSNTNAIEIDGDFDGLLDAVAVGPGSIVSWIQPDNGDEWNSIVKTLGFDLAGTYGIELQASGLHRGVFSAVEGWHTNNFTPFPPPPTDTPGDPVWTHVAMTWDASGQNTVYVNGVPGATQDITVPPLNQENMDLGDWSIGGGTWESGDEYRRLSGRLADFRIFSGALTEEQIREINGIPAIPEPTTFAIWSVFALAGAALIGRRRRTQG